MDDYRCKNRVALCQTKALSDKFFIGYLLSTLLLAAWLSNKTANHKNVESADEDIYGFIGINNSG